jgi:hypothetical protein
MDFIRPTLPKGAEPIQHFLAFATFLKAPQSAGALHE